MRHWSQLATRNWWVRPGRTAGAIAAIALGTAAVVWVTCCYESIRRTVLDWAVGYIGTSHVFVSSPLGKYDQIPQRLAESIATIDNVEVVCPTLIQRIRVESWQKKRAEAGEKPPERPEDWNEVDFFGIDLKTEYAIRDHAASLKRGRLLEESDDLSIVLELGYAEDRGVDVGDSLMVYSDQRPEPYEVRIVGLLERRRIARFQKPLALMRLEALQKMRGKFALVTTLDIRLEDSRRDAVSAAANAIRAKVRAVAQKATIRSAEARIKQIETAQSQQHFVLVMLSCVALLTALFIILSTLSMGLIERIGQLGLMRCVGMTRLQLGWLVIAEVIPLGLVGVLIGVPIGLLLAWVTVWLVPDYIGSFTASPWGIALAATAGLLTALLAALAPAVAAVRVSPMEAARPRARQARSYWLVLVGALAALILVIQHFVVVDRVERSAWFVQMGALSVVLLYLGYALLSPLVVAVIGTPAVATAAAALGVRTRLLQDQVGHAVWRSAGICCGLMVGLSLIVAIAVVNESVTSGWQFPKHFPEAYIWSFDQMRTGEDAGEYLAQVPGVRNYTAGNAVNVIVEERSALMEAVQLSTTWFMGCDPDTFLELMQLDFIQGDKEIARGLLKEGGHILIADDFARSRNKNLGDTVKIFYGTTTVFNFKVAGVIRSPSIDIAAGYFQAHAEYNIAASGSVMGSNADLKRLFNVNGTKMILLNLDPPADPPPADWPPPRESPEGRALNERYYETKIPLDKRWQRWKEEQILKKCIEVLDAPQANYGTVRELKDEIDARLVEMTRLMTAVPGVALIVAALGVANLMMANVTSRARQIAVLRAVGATRGLVLRMVIGEAIVLGILGCSLGLALGVHLARNITELVDTMWGYRVSLELPWGMIVAAGGLTIGLCLIAGLLPARHASRTNIVDALHVS